MLYQGLFLLLNVSRQSLESLGRVPVLNVFIWSCCSHPSIQLGTEQVKNIVIRKILRPFLGFPHGEKLRFLHLRAKLSSIFLQYDRLHRGSLAELLEHALEDRQETSLRFLLIHWSCSSGGKIGLCEWAGATGDPGELWNIKSQAEDWWEHQKFWFWSKLQSDAESLLWKEWRMW